MNNQSRPKGCHAKKITPVIVLGVYFKCPLSPLGMRRTANEKGR